jgi:hypothetical protein
MSYLENIDEAYTKLLMEHDGFGSCQDMDKSNPMFMDLSMLDDSALQLKIVCRAEAILRLSYGLLLSGSTVGVDKLMSAFSKNYLS